MQATGLVECALSKNHWDLGSIPRSPQMLVNIFSNVFLCSLPNSKHHMPSCISVPCVHSHKSNGPEVLTTMLPSQ